MRTGRHRWRAAVVGAVVIGAMVLGDAPIADGAPGGAGSSKAAAAATVPEPADDPFYEPPAGFEAKANGSILRTRDVSVNLGGLVPVPVKATEVLVKTTDTTGEPVTTTSTVLVPGIPYLKGRRPLVAYQAPINSLGDQCQPSYTLRVGGFEGDLAQLAPYLLQGYVVTVTDHEGPRFAYAAGVMAAHSVLDNVRAATELPGTGLTGAQTPIGMTGYSGGAIATGWAAQLQPTYAPELDVKGVASGGTPADLLAVARTLDGGLLSGIFFLATAGVVREYPYFTAVFNDAGKAMLADVADDCLADGVLKYTNRSLSEFVTLPDPLTEAVLDQTKMGNVAPSAPVYLYHSLLDEGIPYSQAVALKRDWCAQGATVDFDSDLVSEHVTLAVKKLPNVVSFLAARFAGRPAPNDC